MKKPMDDLVLIARVRKIYGLKGEVEIQPFTWNEQRFKNLGVVSIRSKDGKLSTIEVQAVHYVHKGIRLKFKGFDDRDAAETLSGAEILIPESERAKLPNGPCLLR